MRKVKGLLGKRGMAIEQLGWWFLAVFVLVIMLGGYLILKGKGIDALQYLKDLLRIGG